MLYYKTKSMKAAADLAAMLADGKEAFVIWAKESIRLDFDRAGNATGRGQGKPHFDAVEVWPSMSAKEITAAHRLAAGRRTCREKEEAAAAILDRLPDISAADRLALLDLVNVAYHGSGKIEGCFSVDGCASCDFCRKMISAGACNPLVICRYCYADRDSYKEFSWRRHTLNARILSTVLFTAGELARLAIDGQRCRFNEDGDTVNETHARNLLRISYTRPGTMFGYWYKNHVAVEAGLHAEGFHTRDQLPKNVRFIHSSVLIGFRVNRTWFDDATFTVYPDAETTAAAIAGGSWACNGKRCRACGYWCYTHERRPEPIDIAELLRCKETERAAILDAYRARLARLAA